MIKKLKTAILVVINLLLIQGVYGQDAVDMTTRLSQKFLSYIKAAPREEIYIHTDREEYISGEDLWFNTYLIDRQSFKPSINSRIVYIELLNAGNRPIVQKRIFIDKGFGPGQIVLPDTLSTGTYTLRAYTSWMKNFLPYNCFMKNIEIFNTLNTKGFQTKEKPASVIQKKDDMNIKRELNNSGVSLTINTSREDTLGLFVKSDKNFRTENDNHIFIFIQSHGNIEQVSSEKIDDDLKKIFIPEASFIGGISQITIFDSKGRPLVEKYVYTPAKYKDYLTIHSADSCGLRSKISINIEPVKEESGLLNSANLSISVRPFSSETQIMGISDYLLFGTEFGDLRNYFRGGRIADFRHEVIDSILLNVKSNWIDWSAILSDALPHFRYQMEKEDQIFFGKLLNKDQQPVHSSEIIILCTPGKEASFQYTRTNSEGNFNFNLNIDEELKDLIIMPDDISKNYRIIIF